MTKLYKIVFSSTLIMGTLITISSQSWLGMWLGLEINLLSIIPLMNDSKNMMSTEASMKYFITQALASSALLMGILMSMNQQMMENSYYMIINSALFTKMGAAPFHFWFPEVIEGLSWINSFVLLTWQKIAPMIMIMYNNEKLMTSMIIIWSMMISGIMIMNQMSMRKILAYSSINHIGWMLAAMMLSETIWFIYFMIYTVISLNIIIIMEKMNIFNLNQLFNSMKTSLMMKIMFIVNFMSLGGLPPFLGFFPKWITIQNMININSLLMSTMMILMTLLTLYAYIRITISTILLQNDLTKNKNNINSPKMFYIMTFNVISIMGLMICTLSLNII